MLLEKLQNIINELDGKCQELPHVSRMNIDTILYRLSESRTLLHNLIEIENGYNFESTNDEVQYFKVYKPAFTCYCIYYERIFDLEITRPFGEVDYYSECRNNLKKNSIEIIQDIRYYRMKETNKDLELFHRDSSKKDIFGIIKAYEMLEKYIDLNDGRSLEEKINDTPILKWTRSKSEYTEFVNGMHLNKCFNDGNLTLEEINKILGRLWDVHVPDIHSATHDVYKRKEPAKFYLSLAESIRDKKRQLLEKLFGK